MTPETTITAATHLLDGGYSIRDLVDLERLRTLFERFSRVTGLTIGFLDHPAMNILIATNWRDICTRFHRCSAVADANCLASNRKLMESLVSPDQPVIEVCDNGLVDCAVPIIIEGKHLASLATGQMLLEPPDVERFRAQAREFGYDEDAYLAALAEVEVVDEDRLREATVFLGEMAFLISEMGYARLKLRHEAEERKQTELATRENETRLRLALGAAQMGAWDYNFFTNKLTWSEEIFELFDLSPCVPSREMIQSLVHPDDQSIPDEAMQRAVSSHTPYLAQYRVMLPGKVKWVEDRGTIDYDEAGQPVRVIGLAQNITERKLAEEELHRAKEAAEAASETKSRFLLNMSHELRTPMNGVLGMIQLAMFEELSPTQRECLSTALDSGRRLVRIISDILEHSRAERGRLTIVHEPYKLRSMVQEVVRLLQPEAELKGLRLSSACASGVPDQVIGDRVRLQQVLTNLVANAVKFTERGEVAVAVDCCREATGTERLVITVTDTGVGIPPEKQYLLFQPFSQVDDSLTRRHGGAGLGLVICKEILERMGGEIACVSEPGKGSAFTVTLPCEAAAASAPAAPPPSKTDDLAATSPQLSERPRILVAEDDPVNRAMLQIMLQRYGFQPMLAADGQQALQLWGADGCDLIIMDVQMPVMNGIDATVAIRRQEEAQGRHVPILGLTAHAAAADEQRCLNAGMDGFLAKPVDLDELHRAIRRQLDGTGSATGCHSRQ